MLRNVLATLHRVTLSSMIVWMAGVLAAMTSVGFASLGNIAPQAANGVSIEILNSDGLGASLSVSGVQSDPAQEALTPFSGGMVWAVPPGTAQVQISVSNLQWRVALPGELPDSVIAQVLSVPQPIARTSDVMRLRGIPLVSLGFNGVQRNEAGDGVRICEHFEAQLTYTGGGNMDTRTLSSSFYDLARGVAANLDEVLPVPVQRPEPYLIITPSAYQGAALSSFVTWKRARGHLVTVVTTDVTGTTAAQILTYLQNVYDTWDAPPVFVQIIGDEDGTNPVPTWHVPGFYTATIASDHPYTLLDGADFLPDVFIGRLSVDTQAELQTVVNKIVNYESQPYEPTGAWRSRMLITGVRSSNNFFPTYNSSWPTLQWIGRQFIEDAGYAQIDSVPYPPGNASQINNLVNAGESFIAYRGFGSPSDWTFPPYNLNDIQNLSNGARLPVIMSIVCGGGAFSDQTDPCFGEKWLRLGTPSTPRGAVGFIGPSELDTKTRWNNTNIAGIFNGIIHEGVNTLGAAMLRGKMELFRQFPNNVNNHEADSDRSVSFYFKCYNLLGDPGLTFFVGPARDLTANAPASVPRGTSAIDLSITENGAALDRAWGTVTAADTIFSRAVSDTDGHIVLPLPQAGEDTVLVTLTKPRHEPQRYFVALPSQGVVIGESQLQLVDNGNNGSIGNGNSEANPGERIALRFTLHNYGSNNYPGGTLALASQSADVQVFTPSIAIPALAAGVSSPPLTLLADVAQTAPDQTAARLTATVDNNSFSWPVSIDLSAPVMNVTGVVTEGSPANPEPQATSRIALQLSNTGHAEMPAVTAILRSHDSHVVVLDSVAQYPAIAIGGNAPPTGDGFQVQIGSLYTGDWAAVELILSATGFQRAVTYPLAIGNIEVTDPTHPDGYGYRMFQDIDAEYPEAPTYAWVEVDPTRGGSGTLLNINDAGSGDDTTKTIPLPFNFTFYGVTYSQVSICSNGFISFGDTDESYFRNYMLPAIASPDNMVCVFWDDLFMPTNGRIYTYHDASGGRFIIEWSHLKNAYSTGLEETFQLQLFNTDCWPTRTGDGDLLMQYQVINNVDGWDNYCTIGLQDRDQGYALPITYAHDVVEGVSTMRSGQAFLFTTGRPANGAYVSYAESVFDDDTEGGSNGNGDGVPQNAETIELQVRLLNTGPVAAPASSGILRESDLLITLLDSTMSFPAITPGETVTGSAVRAVLNAQTPNGHSANFILSLSGGALPCVVLPSFSVSAPLLSLLPMAINDDAVPPSNGNGNGEFNANETIELLPGAANFGGNVAHAVEAVLRRLNTAVTIQDSMAQIGEILVNGQLTAADPFVVHTGTNPPDGQPVHLRVVLRDGYGSEWSQDVDFAIVRPALSSGGLRAADPQGNGDNRLVGGESGELYPRLVNDGLGAATNVSVSLSTDDTTITLQNTEIAVGTVSAHSTREAATPALITVASGLTEPRNVPIDMHVTGDGGIDFTSVAVVTIGDVMSFEDFENGSALWSVFGTDDWHLQQREFSTPVHAFYCGSESDHEYRPNADAYLRSPIFEFSGTGQLLFSTKYETASAADVCRVQLQIGAATYYLLDSFSGDGNTWQQRSYSLAGYPPTETAHIRFWFDSDNFGEAEGWYVDDVILLDEAQPVTNGGAAVIPKSVTLSQNYPNPFNHRTTLEFGLPVTSHVSVALYDITGRHVTTLMDEPREAGTHKVSWQPLELSSGLYFVRLQSGATQLTRKLLYLK